LSSRLVAYISNIPAVLRLEYFPDTSGGPDPAPFESNLLPQVTGLVVLSGLPRVVCRTWSAPHVLSQLLLPLLLAPAYSFAKKAPLLSL